MGPICSSLGPIDDTYNQTTAPYGPFFFLTDTGGNLWRVFWQESTTAWVWEPHGVPEANGAVWFGGSNTGALLNSAGTGLKVFVQDGNGSLFERFWDAATSSWGWTPHGAPGALLSVGPGACFPELLTSEPFGPFFFLVDRTGNLWRHYWASP